MARSPLRISPFLRGIETLWLEHPDMRFGQLVMNLCRDGRGAFLDPWNWEDSDWQRAIEAFRAQYPPASPVSSREAGTAE